MWVIEHISEYINSYQKIVAWGQNLNEVPNALENIRDQYMREYGDYFADGTHVMELECADTIDENMISRYGNLLMVYVLTDTATVPLFNCDITPVSIYTIVGVIDDE